jgi:TonB family protein
MNGRSFHATAKCVGMRASLGFALAALFLMASASRAQQQLPAADAAPAAISSPEIDALAAKLAARIAKNKMKSVIVVGVPGPERSVTELGVSVRNALSDSLARQAHGIKVIDSEAIREFLRQSRIAEDMMYSDALREWITEHLNADGFVSAHLRTPVDGHAHLSADLSVLQKGTYVRDPRVDADLVLTDSQTQSAGRDFQPGLKIPAAKWETEGVAKPVCIFCRNPEYSAEARKLKIEGAVTLLVTVRTDGITDDIFVTQPAGYGLDAQAVNQILSWKFKPAIDAQGHAVAMQIPVEVTFKLQ